MLSWISKDGKLKGYKVSRASFFCDKIPEIEVVCSLKDEICCGESIKFGKLEYKVDCVTGDEEKKQVIASLNLDYLKSKILDLRQYKTLKFSEMLEKLPEISFETTEVDEQVLSMSQKVDMKVCTAYDLLKRVLQTKNLGFYFVSNQKIKVADFAKITGRPKLLAHKNCNLLALETRVENYENYNTVKIYGKGIETTKKIEGAYPEKIKVIVDERFSDQSALDEYAASLLADYSQPYFEINVKIANLDEEIRVLDTVQIIDERLNNINFIDSTGKMRKVGGRKALARVTSIEIEDGVADLTLQNKRQNLADIFADYQEEQKELKSEQENFARETAQNFDNFNANLETAKTDFSSSIAAAKANFNKEIEDAKHIFREELIRTNKEFSSKYEEIDRTIQDVRSDYRSEIRQTAREISLQVDRVEERVSENASDIRHQSAQIDVQADRITSVVNDVREAQNTAYSVQSEFRQTASEFSWKISDLTNRVGNMEVRINRFGLFVDGGDIHCNVLTSNQVSTDYIYAARGTIGWWNSDGGQ